MSEDNSSGNFIGVKAVYDAVLRLEGKFEGSQQRIDQELDAVKGRMDRLEGRLEGSLQVIKWLGPTGLAALILGVLVMTRVIPIQ